MQLLNQKIFITGGSGGIGASTVKEALRQGAHVAFSYNKNKEKADSLLQELKNDYHQIHVKKTNNHEPFAVQMDITDPQSITSACQIVLERFQGIDGVVNNAGMTQDQILLRMRFEDFHAPIQTNLYGCYGISKAFLKTMLKARKGAFVHVTSVSGQIGQVGQANYAASKAGIQAFSKSLAREMASRGIRSNCVAPGFIQTRMTENIKGESTWLSHIPMQKIGQPLQVAKPICFLLSSAADYITGHTLNVNGGLWMN